MSGGIYTTDKSKTLVSLADVDMGIILNKQAPVYDSTLDVFTNQNVATSSTPITANLGDVIIGDGASGITSTNILFVDTVNNRVGINNTNPQEDLDVDGNIRINTSGTGRLIFYDSNDNHEHGEIDGDDDGTEGGRLKLLVKPDAPGASPAVAMTIRQDGDVGIGTEDPAQRLDIKKDSSSIQPIAVLRNNDKTADNGIALQFAGLTSADVPVNYGSIKTKITNHTTPKSELQFFHYNDSGTETQALTLDHDGNFGFNQIDPSFRLDVKFDGGGSGNGVRLNGGSYGDGLYIRNQYVGSGATNFAFLGQPAFSPQNGGALQLYNNAGDEKVRLNNAGASYFIGGDVGIGTDTPATKLHTNIVGSEAGEADIARFSSLRASDGNLRFLDIGASHADGFVSFDVTGTSSGNYIFRRGGSQSASLNGKGFAIGDEVADNTYQGLTIKGDNPSVRMKTTSAGGWTWNEYVNNSGTNSFSAGTNHAVPYYGIKAGAGLDNPHLSVDANGRVGIGLINQPNRFTVAHNGHGISIDYIGASALPGGAGLYTADNSTYGFGYGDLLVKARTDQNGAFYSVIFYTAPSLNNPVERMRITPTGNVGIGTTTPSEKLDVNGTINATAYSVGGTAGFTGTGAYTNFTIVNGIITNAS